MDPSSELSPDLPAGSLPPGSRVGRYRIVRLIDRGGMSSVFLAEHRALGTEHALKVLQRPSRQGRRRLVREGRVMARLRHPAIAAVTDLFELQGHPVLVMDYHPGGSLADHLEAEGRLSLEEAEAFTLSLCEGLALAHAAGVIHRDIKPANILLDRAGGALSPRLADFGIALAFADLSERFTPLGVAMGTPGYCAPEQIVSARDVDARADLFSLGAVLYEAISGRRAYRISELLEQSVARYTTDPRPPLGLVRPEVPARIHLAVEGALALDPDARIPDLETFLAVWTGARGWEPAREEGLRAPDAEALVARGAGAAADAQGPSGAPTEAPTQPSLPASQAPTQPE